MSKLLIVDDDELMLMVMTTALSEAGYEIDTTTNGKDALAKLDTSSYDLLLTDILMPEIDGLEVIDEAIGRNPDITILAISGGGPEAEGGNLLDAALTSGADAILQKPFRPDELVRTVRALLR